MKVIKKRVLITGSNGFIGHHLIKYLKSKGYWVRGVDIVPSPFLKPEDYDEFKLLDLRDFRNCVEALEGIDEVYALAAQNGSIEFTSKVKALIVHDNTKINLNTAEACRLTGVKRVLFSSSACVYPISLQTKIDAYPMKETDAYPAQPDSEYGWEKLYSERMYKSYEEDYGLEVRIVRFFNIYGPEGHYDPIKAKAPTSLSRKVVLSKGDIEVWGDGKQTRSFCYIDDCIEAVYKMMKSDIEVPVNIGTSELLSVDDLVDMIAKIAGKKINKVYNLNMAQGVRGRHSNFSRASDLLKWEPKVKLEQGLEKTYNWVKSQYE